MANNQSVRRHLDAFTRGRIIGKLEEGRSVTSVAAEFGLLTASFHDFGDNFKLQEQLSGGSVVVVHEEPHPQMTGTLSYRPEETGGRQREKSLDTRHRRLDDRYRVLPWPEDCTVGVCLHDALYDESRFSLSSDSHRILIWRERGSRNHSSHIIERDRYGGRCVLVWGSIMLGSRTDLHIFDAGSVNGTRYCNEILLPYVRLFRGAMGLQFLFMDDNAPCHRTVAAEQLLESEDIERMDWPARSPDLNPIEHKSFIECCVVLNSSDKLSELSIEFHVITETLVPRVTVSRRLHEERLFARRPAICVPLISAPGRAHSAWSAEYSHWNSEQLGQSTDESKLSLYNH
ncbi:transposable element Tcb1 transposase [Trichonephila clavipes]|uniref:Transposable element Tcb1 transposase n=1 Tax=Trichonephila clavipes TaxID=2585209 RepID=A0A8X6URD4_TRICX|nr:transposable element Tcb1 transposase [Trichonephila clavipes]